MPDIKDFLNESTGRDTRSLVVRFQTPEAEIKVPFNDRADGEKCFFISAVVLAANQSYGPLFCFWDEPDNFFFLSEVRHFILSLSRLFTPTGQLVVTSHNPEAIRRFSDENILVLDRHSHLEPTVNTQQTTDPYNLASLKHYRSLMPLAMEANKPMFFLLPADVAIVAHQEAVRSC